MKKIKMKIISLIFLFIPLLMECSYAADVYVSTSGSDSSGTGSLSSPYRTIQKGINALKVQGPGNKLYLRGGEYTNIPIFKGDTDRRGIDVSTLNDATSWTNSYTIRSYPGEWAVINGAGYSESWMAIFRGSTSSGAQGFIEFSHLELKNAHGSSGCGAIIIRGGPYRFRYLSIHDNTCATGANNPGGLLLGGATGEAQIEYCYLKGNGYLGKNENSSNIAIFSDYIYSSSSDRWGEQVLRNSKGYALARHNNIIRYCFIDGGNASGKTGVGIKNKAPQFLASNTIGQATPVDEKNWSTEGDDYHHNIVINHEFASILNKGDFSQTHHNIVTQGHLSTAIDVGASGKGYRGPWRTVLYNNTLIDPKGSGIKVFNDPDGVSRYYNEVYVYNNLISGAILYDRNTPMAFSRFHSMPSGSPQWDISNLLHARSNYIYNCDSNVVRIIVVDYSLSQINALDNSNNNMANSYSASDPLFQSTSSSTQYKLNSNYSQYAFLSSGGRGGNHPYLSNITIPSYVGACSPTDNSWVEGVLSLSNSSILKNASGDPPWIEGGDSECTTDCFESWRGPLE